MLYLLDRLIIWLSGKIHSVTLCRVDSKGARLSLYRDRSLVIPVESIAHKQESNLCDTCAIAKSTRTLIYNTQSRSNKIGKMWYFLMFQNYYSAEVLKILMLVTDQVLSSIQCETDEFYFLRYDNGQLNSKCVRAYYRNKGICFYSDVGLTNP